MTDQNQQPQTAPRIQNFQQSDQDRQRNIQAEANEQAIRDQNQQNTRDFQAEEKNARLTNEQANKQTPPKSEGPTVEQRFAALESVIIKHHAKDHADALSFIINKDKPAADKSAR